jgi:flagellar hook-associated protein 3 FlgL
MIERIGTHGLSQLLLSQYQSIQSRMAQTQAQIASGKIGTQYADVKEQSGVLAAAKSKAASIAAHTATVQSVVNRINVYDIQLQGMSDLTADLRQAMGEALANGSGLGFMERVRALYEQAVNTLNTKIDGKYIYGGSRSDVAPVNAPTLDDLLAAPTVADVFENTTLKQSDRLDDNETVETGIAASELASDLFQMFKDIATFDAGANGPFGASLTQAQTQFLNGANVAVPAIQSAINVVAAQNGARYKQASDALEQHETMSTYFTKFIGDIEDADLPTAIAKLNADQVAAAASGRMIASLNQLSLLNFLPLA